MRIHLKPELERFAKAAAKTHGFDSIGDYLQHLLEAERARQSRDKDLSEQLRLAAVERYEEDRAMAEEWFPLEEEAYAHVLNRETRGRRGKAGRHLSR